MTIATAKNTPKNVYTATSSQTVFTIGFEFFATADIKVFRNGTALTFNAAPSSVAQFSVQGTTNASDSSYEFGSGGTVTLGGGATNGDSIVIVRDITVERTTDFTPAASFDVTALNTQLDILMAMMAEREQGTSQSLRLADTDTVSADMQLPIKTVRAGKVLEFDADGEPVVSITATSLSTIAGITANITTVAGIAANVTTVAGISANVTTVAGKASEITSVAAKASLITSDFVSDLNTLATSAIVTDLDILANADIVADLAILATSDIVSDLNTLATSAIVADLAILATSDIVADIALLATSDVVSDLNTLATSAIVTDLNILATSDIVTDINLLATSDIVSDLNTLATSDFVSDLNTLASSTVVTNIATVSANVAGVNSFAARYRVTGGDPSSDNDAGDLNYNTSSNALKFYNGSAWSVIATTFSLDNASDTNFTSIADGAMMLYDTATSKWIDNVMSGNATLADTGVLTIADDAITSAKIADNAITNALMADNAVDTAEIAASAVETAKINDGAVTLAKTTGLVGKQTMWIPAGAMYPSTTNPCAGLEQVQTTALRPDLKVLDFATGADEFAQFSIAFPKSWNEGTLTFQPFWTVTGTNTGTVAWQLGGIAVSSDDTINTAFGTLVATTALAHSGTSNDLMMSAESGAVTIAGSPAANDVCFFQVNRDVSADTQSGDARLLGIKLFFTNDALTDA